MSEQLNIIDNENEFGEISKRLYNNLKELEIDFNPLKLNNKDKDILFVVNLKRDSYIGGESFNYEVLLFPNEDLMVIRFISYFLKDTYDESTVSKISEKIKYFNNSTMMGHLQLDIDEEKNEYSVSYKYGVTLQRDGNEMSSMELEEILFYLNFLVGHILETAYGKGKGKETWI